MTITERIFYLIKARGMSQNAFGKAAGIAPSTISDWKTKGHTPSADKIMDICAALNVSAEQLLTGMDIDNGEDSDDNQLDYQGEQLINEYKGLSDNSQKRLLAYARKLSELEQLEEL